MRSRNVAAMMLCAVMFSTGAALADDKFGAGVTLSDATPIARLLERPAEFEGKTVRVEGVVTEVCTAMGCWMALAPSGAQTPGTVLIQVEHDGKIVFPLTAKGKRAAAQGVVEKIAGGEGQEAAAELARQQGAKAEAPAKWRIAATGAVVY
jgi:hypothetical protein